MNFILAWKILNFCGIWDVSKVLLVGRNALMAPQSQFTDDYVESVVDEYAKTVYKLAFSQTNNQSDAEDAFQEVFLRFIRKQPTFENKAHEKAWFIRVTINCCRNIWASPFRIRRQFMGYEIPDNTSMDELDEKQWLKQSLLKLPKKYRLVIHLFYYENLSTTQIARITNKKESTIRMQLTRARRLLKNFLGGE